MIIHTYSMRQIYKEDWQHQESILPENSTLSKKIFAFDNNSGVETRR